MHLLRTAITRIAATARSSGVRAVLMMLAIVFTAAGVQAQTTAFTYQGRLEDAGAFAEGPHDFRFRLFDALGGGNQIGATLCADNLAISQGLFTVQLDFGQQFASAGERYLEIEVRADTGLDCANSAGFTVLGPRQRLTAAPLASHAKSAFALDAADGSPESAVYVDGAGNVGIGTLAPNKRLTIDGDAEIGVTTSDYHHLRIGGGNSDGFLYGSYARFGDGVHFGYNYFADANGIDRIINTGGPTSRLTMGYGTVILATGGINQNPVDRFFLSSSGNIGVGTVAPLAKLDVRGDIRLGSSGQFRATSGEENLRIVRGIVGLNFSCTGSAPILAGSGFTATQEDCGQVLITFTTPFAGAPAVTGTAQFGAGCPPWVMASNITTTSVRIEVECESGAANWPFSFVAVGPR